MTTNQPTKPPYVIHEVEEKAVTVDWFFGDGRYGKKAAQLILVLVGWFFVILPVAITALSVLNRDNQDSVWWRYHEGFLMWEATMGFLAILTVVFLAGFLALHLIDRSLTRRLDQRIAYNEQRLAQRLEIADALYVDKFGPEALRQEQNKIQIEPYGDLETFELRGLYRRYEVH